MKRNNYKGISPLIAAVLLIAVTVAIATLVTGWVGSLTRGSQTTVTNRTVEATNCAAASITIDQVYITGHNVSTVVVRNSGGSNDLTVNNVTVFNITGGQFSSDEVPTTLDKGESKDFTITPTDTADAGAVLTCPTSFSKAIVVTNCGGVFAEFSGSPKCA